MSRVFDATSRIYRENIRPHVPDQILAELFAQVLEAIHSANHKIPSADGVFQGDGLNHDPALNRAVDRLEKYLTPEQES